MVHHVQVELCKCSPSPQRLSMSNKLERGWVCWEVRGEQILYRPLKNWENSFHFPAPTAPTDCQLVCKGRSSTYLARFPHQLHPWAQLNIHGADTAPDSTPRGSGFEVNQPRPHPSLSTEPHAGCTLPPCTPTPSVSWGFGCLLQKQLLLHIKLKGCALHYLDQKLILWQAGIWKCAREAETAAAGAWSCLQDILGPVCSSKLLAPRSPNRAQGTLWPTLAHTPVSLWEQTCMCCHYGIKWGVCL